MELKPHEEAFPVRPVGIRYICEFCNEGEQIAIPDQVVNVQMTYPERYMIKHRCNKCGKEMMLPKSYPYISWEFDPKE